VNYIPPNDCCSFFQLAVFNSAKWLFFDPLIGRINKSEIAIQFYWINPKSYGWI